MIRYNTIYASAQTRPLTSRTGRSLAARASGHRAAPASLTEAAARAAQERGLITAQAAQPQGNRPRPVPAGPHPRSAYSSRPAEGSIHHLSQSAGKGSCRGVTRLAAGRPGHMRTAWPGFAGGGLVAAVLAGRPATQDRPGVTGAPRCCPPRRRPCCSRVGGVSCWPRLSGGDHPAAVASVAMVVFRGRGLAGNAVSILRCRGSRAHLNTPGRAAEAVNDYALGSVAVLSAPPRSSR